MSSESSDDEYNPSTVKENQTARKSGSKPVQGYQTRRAARNANKLLRAEADNSNSENGVREKRNPSRKSTSSLSTTTSSVRRPPGALYDEKGVHIQSGIDLCDCLDRKCEGCFFECPKCQSPKCGKDCRVYRKYLVDQLEYNHFDVVLKNPIINS